MKRLDYNVSFTTPAFLGNAEQAGQWRTPPFKALLRQWWRVAEVAGRRPDDSLNARSNGDTIALQELRRKEGELFGRAADEGSTASQVRLRLDWRGGTAPKGRWKGLDPVSHPEVTHKAGADLYLAYGPVEVGSKLKRDTFLPAAEGPEQHRRLTVCVPDSEKDRFHAVTRLAHAFGALGSRCRNGWGSVDFDSGGLSQQELAALVDPSNRAGRDWLRHFSRDWREALDTDWCHALGRDEQDLLLWRTEELARLEQVLKALAEVKIAFRTRFHFEGGGRHQHMCDRQVIAYPITNHPLDAWGKDSRSSNQVLFKVLPSGDGYIGVVAHLPHGLPAPLKQRLPERDKKTLVARERQVWTDVHEVLDKGLTRLP